MTKTYTYTKKQASEILDVTPAAIEKFVKEGTLTRERKTPGNNKSTWLYSAEELNTIIEPTPCVPSSSCCQDTYYEIGLKTAKTKKWFQFWK